MSESIYRDLQGLILIADFPILPDDRLFEDLAIDAGSLEDFVEQKVSGQLKISTVIKTSAELAAFMLKAIKRK